MSTMNSNTRATDQNIDGAYSNDAEKVNLMHVFIFKIITLITIMESKIIC